MQSGECLKSYTSSLALSRKCEREPVASKQTFTYYECSFAREIRTKMSRIEQLYLAVPFIDFARDQLKGLYHPTRVASPLR